MTDDSRKIILVSASNDNSPEAEARVHAVVLEIAGLLARQIARDLCEGRLAANDNDASRETGED